MCIHGHRTYSIASWLPQALQSLLLDTYEPQGYVVLDRRLHSERHCVYRNNCI